MISLDVLSCRKCELGGVIDNPVPGIGKINSKLFIVGEHPSGDEGLIGRPFEERQGLILKKVLLMSGINYKDCYMTNVVKCCSNKKISDKNIKSCNHWLWEEMNQVNSSIILCMGSAPTRLLLSLKKTFKLEDYAGKLYDVDYTKSKIACWYSPTYIMNQGKEFETKTIDFFKQCKEYLNG